MKSILLLSILAFGVGKVIGDTTTDNSFTTEGGGGGEDTTMGGGFPNCGQEEVCDRMVETTEEYCQEFRMTNDDTIIGGRGK